MNEEFLEWLRLNPAKWSQGTIIKYESAVRAIARDMLERGVLSVNINHMSYNEFNKVLPTILNDEFFLYKDSIGNKMYSNGLKQYKNFLYETSRNSVQDNEKMYSLEEFIRMVNVQSETVEKYIREGKIKADFESETSGYRKAYFRLNTIKKYVDQYGWNIISERNKKELFLDMVEKMDMSYSYKPVFIEAFLTYMNENYESKIDDIVDYCVVFYEDRRNRHLRVEKNNSIYSKPGYSLNDSKRNILINPFRRFEEMGLMKYNSDTGIVKLLLEDDKLVQTDIDNILNNCDKKLEKYYKFMCF